MNLKAVKGLLLIVMILAVGGCGGSNGGGIGNSGGGTSGGSGTPGSGGGGTTASGSTLQACSDLQWSTHSVSPLQAITVTNLSGNVKKWATDGQTLLNAEVSVNGQLKGAMPVKVVTENKTPTLVIGAPVYPDAPFQGGDVTMNLAFGSTVCPPVTLSVAPLKAPADPRKTIDDAVSGLQDYLLNRAAIYGVTSMQQLLTMRDQLQQGTARLPNGLLLLAVTADTLDQLKTLTSNSALNADEQKLLAAMLNAAGGGFVDGLKQLDTQLQGITTPVVDPSKLPPATLVDTQNGNFVQLQSTPSGSCGAAIMGDPMTITDAATLNKYMTEQNDAYNAAHGLSGATLNFVSLVLPAAGLVGGPVGAAVGTGASVMIYVYKLIQDITINTLPSRFDQIEATLTPGAQIPEDYLDGTGNPNPRWDNALATVSSNGMNLTGQVVDAVATLFGAGSWAGDLGEQKQVIEDIASTVDDSVLNKAIDLLKQTLGNNAVNCFQVGSYTWNHIDISDSNYTTARVIGNQISLSRTGADVNDQTITPEKTGTPELIVSTRKDRFGGHHGEWDKQVLVEELGLDVKQDPYWVQQPGESKQFEIDLSPGNIARPAKTISAQIVQGGGSITQAPTYQSGDKQLMTIKTPTDATAYPVKVQLTRQAIIPDAGGSMKRTTTLTIRNDQAVDLTPTERCIGRGETLKLTAQVHGLASLTSGDLTWTVVSGDGTITPGPISGLQQTATYTAPANGTVADVQVALTHPTDPSQPVVADSQIAVGSCTAQVAIEGTMTASADAGDKSYDYDSSKVAPLDPLPTPLELPDPSLFWYGRQVEYQGNKSLNGTIQVCDDANCQTQHDSSIPASVNSDATIGDDADGNVSFNFSFDGNDECLPDAASGADCSHSSMGTGWDVRYYFNIEQASKQQLNVSLQCNQDGDGFGASALTIIALRRPSNGSAQDISPINIPSLQTLMDELKNGQITQQQFNQLVAGIKNVLMSKTILGPCGTASGQSQITKTFDVPGPVIAGKADHGLIVVGVGLVGALPHVPKSVIRQIFDQAVSGDQTGGTAPALQPMTGADLNGDGSLQELPGSYQGSVQINGTISLKPVN